MIELAPYQLKAIIEDATETATIRTLCAVGLLKPDMTKAEAYRIYGRAQVDRWITEGLIEPVQDGVKTKIRLDRIKLESLRKSANRMSWWKHNR